MEDILDKEKKKQFTCDEEPTKHPSYDKIWKLYYIIESTWIYARPFASLYISFFIIYFPNDKI